jgi:hypothetical protein
MKRLGFVFGVLSFFLPLLGHAAQNANVKLHCLSLKFSRAEALDSFGFEWSLDTTTLNSGINGELAPGFVSVAYSNSAWIELYDELSMDTVSGAMAIDIPETGDANGNGVMDFFEISESVNNLSIPGAYNISGFGSGGMNCTWYRAADSPYGICVIPLPDPWDPFEDLVFQASFELLQLSGPLSYTPAPTNVNGILSVEETNSLSTLNGPVAFVKSATNRFNLLTLQSAYLTNSQAQTLSLFAPRLLRRDLIRQTNYHGPVEFNDGEPNTAEDDYYSWEMLIQDANDADHDGIPDFSDDPTSQARRPVLTLTRGTTNLLLKISGDVGRLHHVLGNSNLLSGTWVTNLSVTLTNDPQTVSLPLPTTPTRFWRALVP